ncbi:hypothetical protein [Psychrobacter sp. CAL346-MNA-CIBAN-0220]|uniref:hypothetical protein n=1 Tax=Psychrobacter sp. CAL346-MNA-CIBAN-0220 TaxID=3140457 RepID=UPI003317A572
MSQIFNLQLATGSLRSDAQQLGVSCEQLQQIRVEVSATITQQTEPQLWLTYQIQLQHPSLAAQLNWPTWDQARVNFTDYLWEQTCLECFISDGSMSTDESTAYVEVNASPGGCYALYHFKGYRTPSTLPPTPLLKADGKLPAHINWAKNLSRTESHTSSILESLLSHSIVPPYYYERSFGIPLNQLPSNLLASSNNNNSSGKASNNIPIKQLHPCVILKFSKVFLYFAPIHASPPDFHQRRYWTRFEYPVALNNQSS